MATAPQTWTILTNLQSIIQGEVLVGGVCPYSTFSAADAATYGTANAIYIGSPKDMKPAVYPQQCWIIPPKPEKIYHRSGMGATGSVVYQEQHIEVVHLFDYQASYYTALQSCVNATDALVPVLMRHVDTGLGPTVKAATIQQAANNEYFFLDMAGRSFICWHCTLWVEQVWTIAGGVVS